MVRKFVIPWKLVINSGNRPNLARLSSLTQLQKKNSSTLPPHLNRVKLLDMIKFLFPPLNNLFTAYIAIPLTHIINLSISHDNQPSTALGETTQLPALLYLICMLTTFLSPLIAKNFQQKYN